MKQEDKANNRPNPTGIGTESDTGNKKYLKTGTDNETGTEPVEEPEKKCMEKNSDVGEGSEFTPSSSEEALALDIINSLGDDKDSLSLVTHYCKKHPREVIDQAWKEAKAVPPAKIKKSRGALFNYLVQKYAKERNDLGD